MKETNPRKSSGGRNSALHSGEMLNQRIDMPEMKVGLRGGACHTRACSEGGGRRQGLAGGLDVSAPFCSLLSFLPQGSPSRQPLQLTEQVFSPSPPPHPV